MKKATVQIQFHWIFVVVVGAIILLFFTTMILKQKNVSDQKLSIDVLNNMDKILTGAIVSPQTLSVISAPKMDIDFNCNSFGVGKSAINTKRRIIFAPSLLSGRFLIPWSLPWKTPFRVDNFLYLTTEGVRYVFVNGDGDLDKELFDDIEVTKQFLEPLELLSQINNINNYKFKLIYFNTIPSVDLSYLRVDDGDITAINIIPGTSEDFGTIEFYKYEQEFVPKWSITQTKDYLEIPLIYGAIFSESAEDYECAMNKALQRLRYVAQVYKDRTNALVSFSECSVFYSTDYIDIILDSTVMEDIYDAKLKLSLQNLGAQAASCPLIY